MATDYNPPGTPMDDMESVLGGMDQFGDIAGQLSNALKGLIDAGNNVQKLFNNIANLNQPIKQLGDNLAKGGQQGGQYSGRGQFIGAPIEIQKQFLDKALGLAEQRYTTSSGKNVPYGPLQTSRELGIDYHDYKATLRKIQKGDARYAGGGQEPLTKGMRLQNEETQSQMHNKDYSKAPPLEYRKDTGQAAHLGNKIATEVVEEIGASMSKAMRGASGEISTQVRTKTQGAGVPTQGAGAVAQPTQLAKTTPSTTQQQAPPANMGKIDRVIDKLATVPEKGGGGQPPTGSGGTQQPEGGGGRRGEGGFDVKQFLNMASPFSPMALSWMAMFGMSGQLQPAAQQMGEPSMMGGEWMKQGVRGTMGFGASFTGIPALGKLFNQVATTDAFELYESMHSSFTVLKNVYKSQEKAGDTIQESINLARQTPLEVNDLLKIFSTFSVNPQLRGVLGNKEQMGQLATGVAGLSFLVPEQGTQGAIFAIREALAGQFRSLRNRFNINPELIAASGGMSMTEMQEKPTNFLGALSSFLKQNLGQNTFNELQNTFSKQVGNIYDSLTGGIFKAFRQSGTYESVTNFASQLSNVAGDLFESEGFGNFFKSFGGKITTQFSKASNVLKSMDFKIDTPEVLKEKFGRAFQMITKDVVTATGSDMDSVIEAVAPVAKNVGSMVSGYLSKGLGDVVSGAMGIGVNSIVETLSSGVMSITDNIPGVGGGLRYLQGKALPYQRDIITEHPFATLALGAMAQKPLVNWASGVMQTQGGFTPYMRNVWENDKGRIGGLMSRIGIGGAESGWKGGIGIASVAASLYSLNQVIDSFTKSLPDVDENQRRRYGEYEKGSVNAFQYLDTAYSESITGAPYKRENRGFIETGMMGVMGGMTVASAMRKSMENPYSYLSTQLSGDRKLFGGGPPPSSFLGPPKPQPGQQGNQSEDRFSVNLATGRKTKIRPTYYSNEEWSQLSQREKIGAVERRNPNQMYDEARRGFIPAKPVTSGKEYPFSDEIIGRQKVTPFRQTYTNEQLAEQRRLNSYIQAKESPFIKPIEEGVREIQKESSRQDQSKIRNAMNKAGDVIHGVFVAKIDDQQKQIEKEGGKEQPIVHMGGLLEKSTKRVDDDDFKTDLNKKKVVKTITDTIEEGFIDESGRKGTRSVEKKYTVEEPADKLKPTPQQRLAKQGGIAAGLTIAGGSLLADYMMEDKELTSRDANIMKRTSSIGQQAMSIAPAAAMFNPLIGAGIFAGGAALDLGTKLTYGTLQGDPQKAANQKADRNLRLDKVNKDVAKAISTVAENRISQVTDFAELDELSTFANMDMNAQFQQQLTQAVSSGKVSKDTGSKLMKELPKLGKAVIEGRVKENADDIKQWLVDNNVATKEELEDIEPTELQAMVNSTKGAYIQATRPDMADKINRQRKARIRAEMATMPELASAVRDENKYGGADLQNAIMIKSDQMSQTTSAFEKYLSLNRYISKGGPTGSETLEQSQKFAKGVTEELQGSKDWNRGQDTLKQISIPKEQYMEDKVYNYRERARAIYRPGQLEENGMVNTTKAVTATMEEAYEKELLFNTKPNAKALQKMREESSIVYGREGWEARGPMTNAPQFSQEQLTQEQQLAEKKSNFVNIVPALFGQLSQTHPGALSMDQIGTMGKFRSDKFRGAFDEAKKQFELIPERVENFISTIENIPVDKIEPSASILNKVKKLNEESHGKLMAAALEGQKKSTQEYDEQGNEIPQGKKDVEKKEKEFREIIEKSGGDAFAMQRDLKLAGAVGIGEGKKEKDFYQQASNYKLAKDAEAMLTGQKPGTPVVGTIEQLRSALTQSLSLESRSNLYSSATGLYDSFMGDLGKYSNAFQYNLQESRALTGGGGPSGMGGGPNLTSINGKLMPLSFSAGGMEIPNPEIKIQLDQQRQQNQFTPETKQLLESRGKAYADQLRSTYHKYVGATENMTGLASLPPEEQHKRTQGTLQAIGFIRQLAARENVTLGGEDLGKEELFRQQFSQDILNQASTSLFEKFQKGDTQGIAEFGEQYGLTPGATIESKEGKSPTAAAATMSGVGDAMESISGGLTKLGQAATDAANRLDELLKNPPTASPPSDQPKTAGKQVDTGSAYPYPYT